VSTAVASEAVRLALDAFGVPRDAVVTFVKERENQVFRVRAPGMDRSLRLHRVGYRTDAELASETSAIELFRRAGIRVPVPAPARDGGYVVVVTDEHGVRRQATMQEWIDGGREFADSAAVFSGDARPSAVALRELGALIARMHEVATGGSPDGYERAAWDDAGLAGPAALWGSATDLPGLTDDDRAVLAAVEERLATDLAELSRLPEQYGLIHADFTFENVLVTAGGLAALDFDDSGEGWYLFDLATPAFWCARHPEAEQLIGELAEGYRSVRTLDMTEGWHALLLARGLSYLGWAAARPGDPTSEFHETVMAPWVVDAARRYLRGEGTGWAEL